MMIVNITEKGYLPRLFILNKKQKAKGKRLKRDKKTRVMEF